MEKCVKNEILYIETTPEFWAKEVIRKYNLLPDIETVFINEPSKNSEFVANLFKYYNRKISFSIQTKRGIVNLKGVFVDMLPFEEKRNCLDFIFINEDRISEADSSYKGFENNFKIGHLINAGTITNLKHINE